MHLLNGPREKYGCCSSGPFEETSQGLLSISALLMSFWELGALTS